ncbi:MAG: metal-dependent hydrolase [Oscillospiraceae bacterium]|nr:metal-dependent hydrolase [Oscillospiraceae bacterium]
MLGKTHMMVGIASTLLVTQPDSLTELLTASSAGAIGALISDIDVDSSSSHRDANKVIFLAAAVIAGAVAADYFANFGIIENVINNGSIAKIIVGILLFLVVCAFGKETPHRSFMHSFTALIILDAALILIYMPLTVYFTIGFLSHLVTDIFNKRKLKLFYPLKKGISFNLFHAKGVANTAFLIIGTAVTAIEVVVILFRIYVL